MKFLTALTIIYCITWTTTSSHVDEAHAHDKGHAGILTRMNVEGMNTAKDIFFDYLKDSFSLPNMRLGKFPITKIKIKLDAKQADISTFPPDKIKFNIEKASVEANVGYNIKVLHMTFSAKVGFDIKLQVTTKLKSNPWGRLQVVPENCESKIEKLKISVDNKKWYHNIINIALRKLNKYFGEKMQKKICPEVMKYLKTVSGKSYINNSTSIPFLYKTALNIGLIRPPVATSDSIEMAMIGRCYNKKHNPNQKFPFNASSMLPLPSSNSMFQIAISQYTLNTFIYSVGQNQKLEYSFSDKQLLSQFGIDVSADELAKSFAMFEKYRGRRMYYDIKVQQSPRFTLNPQKISVLLFANISINTFEKDGKYSKITDLVMKIETEGQVKITNGLVAGEVTNISVGLAQQQSSKFVEEFNNFTSGFVHQCLTSANDTINKGVRLPTKVTDRISHVTLQVQQNALVLGSDLTAPPPPKHNKFEKIVNQVINLSNKFKTWKKAAKI